MVQTLVPKQGFPEAQKHPEAEKGQEEGGCCPRLPPPGVPGTQEGAAAAMEGDTNTHHNVLKLTALFEERR